MSDFSLLGNTVTTGTLVIFRRPPWFKRMFFCWAPAGLGASLAAHKTMAAHCTITWSLFGVGMDQNCLAVIPSSPCCRQVSYHWCTLSTGSGICSRLCPKIVLRAKLGRNSSAVFRGWRELLLLPKVAVMVGEEWDGVGGTSTTLFIWGSEEMGEAEMQFLISRKLLSLISVIHFREDFVILKGFTNWIT